MNLPLKSLESFELGSNYTFKRHSHSHSGADLCAFYMLPLTQKPSVGNFSSADNAIHKTTTETRESWDCVWDMTGNNPSVVEQITVGIQFIYLYNRILSSSIRQKFSSSILWEELPLQRRVTENRMKWNTW